MPEIGPNHPLSYRQEIAAPLFDRVQAGGSCAVVGAASMGKSRLIHFLLRADVQQHYLGDNAASTRLVWVDGNRLAEVSEWGLYELMLTALAEAADKELRAPLLDLRQKAILSRSALLAQRNVELAARLLCQEEGLRLLLLLDEFDECYATLPEQCLANLRALRDLNKYRWGYTLFVRDDPANLRAREEVEGFYELISRSVIGLTPYGVDDARRTIEQIAARRQHELSALTAEAVADIVKLSGGHPGLIVALLDALVESQPLGTTWRQWATAQSTVQEECRKLWRGLREAERQTLNRLAQEASTSAQERESLLLKGLLTQETTRRFCFFSPLFKQYAATQVPVVDRKLHLDSVTGNVSLNGEQCQQLTNKEYDLFAFLYDHSGQICDSQQITTHLYPGNESFDMSDSTITTLVRRVRRKIEPDPKRPQYLVNVPGRGYRLLLDPADA